MNAASTKTPPLAKQTVKQKNLVYGLGSTGLSVARYFVRSGIDARYVDSRETPPGLDELQTIAPQAEILLGKIPQHVLRQSSLIVVSPGIAEHDALLGAARNAGITIVSDIELFAAEARAPFVAITGSNGKSTVTTLLSLMCTAAGKRGLAGANLGVPALDLLEERIPDFYILELSSFQLQRTGNLPAAVAVLLNISPDHLDWHRSEEEYRQAKYRIFSQAAAAVWNRADAQVVERVPDAIKAISFGLDEPPAEHYGLRVEDGVEYLARGEKLLLATSDIAMVGRHNYANALAALAAGELLGLALSPMLQVLNQFPGLPHRMQRVALHNKVTYINDSKATNVGAAIASVASVDGKVILIAGGQGKGGNFDKLATATAEQLRAVVLIGEDALKLADAFEGLAPVQHERNLQDAVAHAATIARPGDTVLFAPACASFDQYPNYQARGDDFCRAVRSLAA